MPGPTIIKLSPAANPDKLFAMLASRKYLERRRLMHTNQAPVLAPRYLYKYRGFQRREMRHAGDPPFTDLAIRQLSTIIIDSLLWLSSPEDFNDPFDLWASWTLEGTEEEKRQRFEALAQLYASELTPERRAEGLRRAMQMPAGEMLEAIRKSFTEHRRRCGVCCFAGDPREVLMWSHYANSHTGVCLQFETSRDPNVLMRALSVKYVDTLAQVNWLREIGRGIGEAFLRKHHRWHYEDEYRITQADGARCCVRVAPEALTGVIFGCKADAEVKRAVGKVLYERRGRGLPAVKLYYARQHEERNEIEIWGAEAGRGARWTGRAK